MAEINANERIFTRLESRRLDIEIIDSLISSVLVIMWRPCAPFGFISGFVLLEERLTISASQLVKRSRQMVVNEHIFSTGNAQANLFNPAAIIVIFKESTAKGFIQCADAFVGCAGHHDAEESGSS